MIPSPQFEPSAYVPAEASTGLDCDMAEWVQREYRKGEIDRAGAILVPWWTTTAMSLNYEGAEAVHILQNWRASHAMPLLTFRMGLTKRAYRVQDAPIVAQRLKRFSSVMNKLAREPQMKLSQMQDLGGCRAIMNDVTAVDNLFQLYRGPRIDLGQQDLFGSEGALKCYDYIRAPKADGYRGIHVVGRYKARLEKNEPWNGHRIEIQLRSRLQHAWATAVETVGTFTRFRLKFGGGPEEWRRFFALMGSALAIREGTSLIEGTPQNPAELTRELREYTKQLKVRQRLAGWARALRKLPRRNVTKFKWLLMVLNVTDNTIKVTGFSDRDKAASSINELEAMKRDDLDAVLVWVGSVRDLKAAYPNYYADTGEFIDALNHALRTDR